MNERIKKLISECTYTVTDYSMGIDNSVEDFDKEKFAKLIIKEILWHQPHLLSEADYSFTPAKAEAFKIGVNSFAHRIRYDFGVEE